MEHITMTDAQTAVYDANGRDAIELMSELLEKAEELSRQTGKLVEIYTADGIVADAVLAY